jgi:hypothetical protein
LGYFTGFHSTKVMGLRRVLKLSSATQACKNAGLQIC